MKKIGMFIWVIPFVLLITWLFNQSQIDYYRFDLASEQIETYYRYSSQFDQSISRQLIADYPDYYTSNVDFYKIIETKDRLLITIEKWFPELNEEIAPIAAALTDGLKRKQSILLNFYEINSVLRNTKSYLQNIATTSLTLPDELKVYLLDTLVSSSASYAQAEKRQQVLINKLTLLSQSDRPSEAKLILSHLSLYLRHIQTLNELTNALTSNSLLETVHQIDERLKRQYIKDIDMSSTYEIDLFVASIVLLLGLFLAVIYLNKSHQSYKRLNNEKFKMQEMMIQSEKMLSVGGLAAGMAHEINNPLAGIVQNLQVIRNRLSAQLPKNLKIAQECGAEFSNIECYIEKRGIYNMIESVMESGQRAAKIVNNTLSFSRKGVGIRSEENVNDIVEQTINLSANDYDLKKKYDFRKIVINRQYGQNLPSVLCEASEIQQVLFNIFKNGAQAMMAAGISVPQFDVSTEQQDSTLLIQIKDNGPGMDNGVRTRIFEPFFTTKSPGVGTGLGLSVSYFIITKNHKGEMSVDSSLGNGTQFNISLPINLS